MGYRLLLDKTLGHTPIALPHSVRSPIFSKQSRVVQKQRGVWPVSFTVLQDIEFTGKSNSFYWNCTVYDTCSKFIDLGTSLSLVKEVWATTRKRMVPINQTKQTGVRDPTKRVLRVPLK